MKNLCALLLLLTGLLISSHSVAQGSLAALNAKNGFRDAKLGMPVTQLKGIVRVYKVGNSSLYRRPNDKKSIGDIPLKDIRYMFYKGKLQEVTVSFDEKYTGEINQTLTTSYGNGGKEKYPVYGEWVTQKIRVRILAKNLLPDNPRTNWPCIQYTSIKLKEQEENENLEDLVKEMNSRPGKRQADL